jgi:hypothetical protein
MSLVEPSSVAEKVPHIGLLLENTSCLHNKAVGIGFLNMVHLSYSYFLFIKITIINSS